MLSLSCDLHPRPQNSRSVKLVMLHPPTTNGLLFNYNHIVTLGKITKNVDSGYAWKFEKYDILSIFFSNMPSDSMKHAELILCLVIFNDFQCAIRLSGVIPGVW